MNSKSLDVSEESRGVICILMFAACLVDTFDITCWYLWKKMQIHVQCGDGSVLEGRAGVCARARVCVRVRMRVCVHVCDTNFQA